MKKNLFLISLIAAITTITVIAGFVSKNKPAEINSPKGIAVVELFTSEGCSSCPSADETVARLLAKNLENVYILAFHVDYWNRLGWKDPFSDAAYSRRQSEYASRFNLSSVYTPQVIVNGASEFVGSDENKLSGTVQSGLKKQAAGNINISTKKNQNSITVNYDLEEKDEVLLNLALVQPEASVMVKRGENGGRMLHHVNVVRAFKTISAKGVGSVEMNLSGDLSNSPYKIIAYTQDKNNFHILAAVQK